MLRLTFCGKSASKSWNQELSWKLSPMYITVELVVPSMSATTKLALLQCLSHPSSYWPSSYSETIRIHHECEGGIEKFVPRITDWHHEACQVMTNGDCEGSIFLSHPHTNDGFFSCSPLNNSFYIGKTWKRLPESPEYAEMRHGDIILTLQWCHGSACGCLFFIFPTGWYWYVR